MLGLVDELGLANPVLAGYDIGSRIAQAAVRAEAFAFSSCARRG